MMKQKIKKTFISISNYKDGFTLIELAMVLVVIGLLIAFGVSLIGPMTKRAKIIESREAVSQAKEAVFGWTVKNTYLPPDIATTGGKNVDGFGKDLLYIKAPEIDASGKNACRRIAADPNNKTTLNICLNGNCTTGLVRNIAFVIISGAENYNIQTSAGTPTGCPSGETCVRVYEIGTSNVDDYPTDINRPEDYDDIVQYISLDEIRTAMGCPQPLQIVSSTTLTQGEEDSFYSYSMQAIGGVPPYQWSGTITGGTNCDATHGLNLDTSGLISGTISCKDSAPNSGELTACNANINVNAQVTDNSGSNPVSYNGTISVRPKPLSIVNTEIPSTTVGANNPNFAVLTGTGGNSTNYSWSISGNPSWLSINSSTGVLSVNNPTSAGTYSFTATLSNNACNASNSKNFTITVNPATAVGSPTCSLTANPTSRPTAGPFDLTWSINNGPANGTWSGLPSGGTCTNFSNSSGGTCTTGTISTNTTITLTVTNTQGSSQCATTVYIGVPPGPVPSCTLEASPNPVTVGNPTSLVWAIANGPATATFSPASGTCTTFSNSYGGNCTTGNINANTTFQLSVTNSNGTGLCATTVYTTAQDYCTSVTARNDPNGSVIYVKGGQYGATCTRVRPNRTFNVNQSDTTAVTLWQNSTCTLQPQNIKSIAYSSGGSISADAYAINADGNKNCAVAINDTDTNTWTLVDE